MRKYICMLGFMAVILTGCTSVNSESDLVLTEEISTDLLDNNAGELSSEDGTAVDESLQVASEDIVVYVCGAVVNPGVYQLSTGSRANDAVNMAGGFTEDADRIYVNLAAPVTDGSKLVIPTREETADIKTLPQQEPDTGDLAVNGSGLVNINTAGKEELKSLPGVGDGIAGRIIEYRDNNGNFQKIEDIMKVSGIKDKLFLKIKDQITV